MNIDPRQARSDRQTLAHALRDLRLASGLSGERLAVHIGMSQSRLSKIETGRILPSPVDVALWLDKLECPDPLRTELLELAATATAAYESVRALIRTGLHVRQKELATLEATASTVRYFLPSMLTGLLQTPAYMHEAIRPSVDPSPGDVERMAAMKIERQQVLHDRTKRFHFVLTENAIRWRLADDETMAAQIRHLIELSHLPSVSISILPMADRFSNPAFQTYTVYDQRLVTIELYTGRLVFQEPKEIEYHTRLFDWFERHAQTDDAARGLLLDWADSFRRCT